MTDKFVPEGYSLEIFKSRYAITQEETWDEACRRVARQMALAELPDKQKTYEDKFYEALVANQFVPGGRIWHNSGRNSPQLLNCFVLSDQLDSKEGWGEIARQMIVTSMTGGGCGIDFSDVRPRGAPIAGTSGTCPGPVELMRLIDACAKPVRAGGQRRVALMFSLDLDHPDIMEFLDAKLEKGELTHANVSVRSKRTSEFIKAVKKNEDWELSWKGKYRKTISAQEVWNKIVTNAYNSAEPGFLNWELVGEENNIAYINQLVSSNPCKPLDATILTDRGYITFAEALKLPYLNVITADGTTVRATKPFKTGEQREIMRVRLSNGRWLKGTPNHRHMTHEGSWIELSDLKVGQRLKVNLTPVHELKVVDRREYWLGVLMGWMWGDGSLFEDKQGFHLKVRFGNNEFDFADDFSDFFEVKLRRHGQKPDTCKVGELRKHWVDYVVSQNLHYSIRDNGYRSLDKNYLEWTRGKSSSFKLGFLKAYFTADGSVRNGGISALYSINRDALDICAEMLNEFGIYASTGKRGNAKVISGAYGTSVQKEHYFLEVMFSEFDKIGFLCDYKNRKLVERQKATSIRKSLVKNSARIVQIERNHSIEDVYDISVDHPSHSFLDGGVVTHNCGEIALERFGNCCLGHLMLSRFVDKDDLDWHALANCIRTGVRFLDNVLTVNSYPLPEMRDTAQANRRIGLGVTALADTLALLDYRYGSNDCNRFVDKLFRFISKQAYEASVMLAIEKGAFPTCDPKKHVESGFMKRMPAKIRSLVEEHGIRNCALLTVAPTGTVSILSGNCSSGIESMFSAAYERRYWDKDERKVELVFHPLFAKFMREGRSVDHFIGSRDLTVREHLEVQKIVQKHIDNAVSKTINVPESYSIEDMSATWLEYLPYVKGTTFYRENTRGFVTKDGKIEDPPLKALSLENAEARFKSNEKAVEDSEVTDCPKGTCYL